MDRNIRSARGVWQTVLILVLIAAVVALGYVAWTSRSPKPPAGINVELRLPKVPPGPDAPAIPSAPIPRPQ